MVVFDTVDLIFSVHSEGHSIKALITDDAAETSRVVRLPKGLQNLQRQMSQKEPKHESSAIYICYYYYIFLRSLYANKLKQYLFLTYPTILGLSDECFMIPVGLLSCNHSADENKAEDKNTVMM